MPPSQTIKTYQKALAPQHGEREARALAYMALRHVLDCSKTQLLLKMEEPLSAEQQKNLDAILSRLLAGEPIQYIIGWTDFYGLQLQVNPQVLIPRPETEELVEWVLQYAKSQAAAGKGLRLLDVGTGSGCIALALKKELSGAEVWAMDISAGAVQTAARNARNCQLHIHLLLQDILQANKTSKQVEAKYHIIVSNPPYIAESERELMPDNVLQFEPHIALFTQNNSSLRFYEVIAEYAMRYLLPGGRLFFELNQYHAQQIGEVVAGKGFEQVQIKNDLNGAQRLLSAQKPQ